jgi:GH25 family lysozyme M1 (1,4-beta-N-acetylmuramidase)/LysM repeat protein
MNGIDVSAWQPRNITALVPHDFAIIKATEGTGYVSDACDQQYQIAKAAGKGLGVYHFASGVDAVGEADHFVNAVQGYLGEAILVLDYEANAINRGREWVRTFVKRIKERTNVPPVIYASTSVISSQQLDKLAAEEDCGLWAANYGANNQQGYSAAPQMMGSVIRQYTSKGRLPGYGGDLDLNYSILSLADWKKYANGKRGGGSAPAPTPAPVVPTRKSNDEIATEVMRGAWGNGDDRKNRLAAAGYDYQTIQDIINGVYVRRPDDVVAQEVIDGKWGIGDDRKARLASQGYNYDAIQSIVNKKLNAPAPAQTLSIVIPSGAYLSNIAAQYGTSVAQLLVWNKPKYPQMTANYIQAGWNIRVR